MLKATTPDFDALEHEEEVMELKRQLAATRQDLQFSKVGICNISNFIREKWICVFKYFYGNS